MTAASPFAPKKRHDFVAQPTGPRHCVEVPTDFDRIDAAMSKAIDRFAAELNRKPIEEIRALMQKLTYGEMMELAQSIWTAKPEETVTQENLPAILHRWSKEE